MLPQHFTNLIRCAQEHARAGRRAYAMSLLADAECVARELEGDAVYAADRVLWNAWSQLREVA